MFRTPVCFIFNVILKNSYYFHSYITQTPLLENIHSFLVCVAEIQFLKGHVYYIHHKAKSTHDFLIL